MRMQLTKSARLAWLEHPNFRTLESFLVDRQAVGSEGKLVLSSHDE
jgi:hypothetical protein